jgi:OmcA/MtrC family decaheme c-type cytochrome
MQRKSIIRLCMFFVLAATAAFTLNGCSGTNGANGKDAPIPTTGTISAKTFTNDDLNNVIPTGHIISATIPGKNPVVTFQVVDKVSGAGITGLKTFGLHIAKLVPEANGSSSYWVNYIDKGISLPAPLAFATTGSGASAKAVTGAITKPSADPGMTLVPSNQNGLDLTKYPVGSVLLPGYTVVDNNDGTYTVTFGSDITSNANAPYDANAVTRIGVTVTSIATPGVTATGPLTAAGAVNTSFLAQNRLAMVYDFTPATGTVYTNPNGGNSARDIVTTAACEQCHAKIALIGGHQAARPDVRVCVMCHTSTNTSGEGEFVTFIHRIHMGEELPAAVSAESVLNPTKPLAKTAPLVGYDATYPQDIRNCTQCHKGVDGANWQSKPNRTNCSSCHNDINFTTGAGHNTNGAPGAQTNDNGCQLCHGGAAVSAVHLPVTAPDSNNVMNVFYSAPYNGSFSSYSAAQKATGVAPGNSNTNAAYTVGASVSRLPVGAKAISYVVKSTSLNSSKQPVIVFKFQSQTAQADGTMTAPADVVFNTSTGTNEMITGFVGSPSVYFGYAVPQDNSTAPSDYNGSASGYLKRIWNGTAAAVGQATQAGTISATPDSSGYYTVTLTGVTVPDNAVMLTGGIGYTYGLGSVKTKVGSAYVPFATTTQPLTQVDLAAYPYVAATFQGGLSVPAPNQWKVATGYTGRRLIVDNSKCNACHGRLGVKPTFHAGQRNDAQTCTFCHNVNRVNSGWGVNIKEAVHAIHASGMRVNKFSWEATAGDKMWNITYPGYLQNCEQCHIAGMYDFSNSAYTANNGALMNNLLFTTVATGTISSSAYSILTGNETVLATDSVISPFITAGAAYGSGYAVSSTGVPTQAAATTLVNSPISSACFACHDTASARAHMTQNGGTIYAPRSAANLATQEACLVCHGTAGNSVNATVPTIKAAHRWW